MTNLTMEPLKRSQKEEELEQFRADVLNGLAAKTKNISSKYLYDEYGSKLFEDIMELDEYYLTNSEFDIFKTYKTEIAEILSDKPFNLVELGVGNGKKTKILLEEFLSEKLNFKYAPIDISESIIKELEATLLNEFPNLEFQEIVSEYFHALNWLSKHDKNRNFVLFLGSNIGNFSREEIPGFLKTLWASLNPGDLVLIGFDLKKDIDTLLYAYNDAKGVTKEFNLNLLTRINRELGGHFDLSKFRHYETYNPINGAMESYLISLEDQKVRIDDFNKEFHFGFYEPIHLEFSVKFTVPEIEEFAENAGFKVKKTLYDSRKYYVDSIWEIVK